jgi:hypothetical protein
MSDTNQDETKAISVHQLIDITINVFCAINKVSPSTLYNKTRERNAVETRRMVWGYLRENTGLSLVELGDLFSRDHPSTLHSIKKHQTALSLTPSGGYYDSWYTARFRDGALQIRHMVSDREKNRVYKEYMLTYYVEKNDKYIAPVVRATSLVEAIQEYELYNPITDEELVLAKAL